MKHLRKKNEAAEHCLKDLRELNEIRRYITEFQPDLSPELARSFAAFLSGNAEEAAACMGRVHAELIRRNTQTSNGDK